MKRNKLLGFSLMEMLVVMLIAAVVTALSAPMITKKLSSPASSAGSLWTSLTGGNIGFNTNTAGISSVIGGDNNDIAALGNKRPKLVIGTKSGYPHIGFLCNDKATGILLLDDKNRIILGNNTKTEGRNSIAIGSNITNTGKNSAAIGFDIKNTESDTIVLGNENTTVVIPGKVKFNGISIGENIDFDFNNILNAAKIISNNKKYNIPPVQQGVTAENTNNNKNKDTITIKINGKPYYYQSDKRSKNLISENNDGLEKIKQLKIYNYTYKDDSRNIPHVGVTAQELREIFPNSAQMDKDGFLQIRHEDMFFAMINAIKELDKTMKEKNLLQKKGHEQLQKQINQQRAMIVSLNEEIKALKKEISNLK